MRLLDKIFGREDESFELLEEGAAEAKTSVILLRRYLAARREGGAAPSLDEFTESRRKQKRIRSRVLTLLGKSFVTQLEREDIQALAFALYRIPKAVEKTVERLSIYPGRVPYDAFERQAELLTVAVEAVVFMVSQLRQGADIEKVEAANDRLQRAEGEADKMMLSLLGELYRTAYDPKELAILSGLYETMERAVDRCRTAGNIVVQIAMKHA